MYFLGLVLGCVVLTLLLYKPVGRWYDTASGPAQRWLFILSSLAFVCLVALVFYVPEPPSHDLFVILADLVPIPLVLVAYHRYRRINRIGTTKDFQKVLRAKKKATAPVVAQPGQTTEEKIAALLRRNSGT